MATILITGATGFLGKYVVDEFLRHGYQVVAHGRNATRLAQLHDRGIQTLQGDLQELSRLTMRVDAVVHAAALSTIWGPWQRFYRNNVEGTHHVVQFCRQIVSRVLCLFHLRVFIQCQKTGWVFAKMMLMNATRSPTIFAAKLWPKPWSGKQVNRV